jgi:hypothetical protein
MKSRRSVQVVLEGVEGVSHSCQGEMVLPSCSKKTRYSCGTQTHGRTHECCQGGMDEGPVSVHALAPVRCFPPSSRGAADVSFSRR